MPADSSVYCRVAAADRRLGATLLLGHGAGAGQRHPFMVRFAEAMAARGIDACTFDFPYMAERRKAPDPGPVLERAFLDAIAAVRARPETAGARLFIGGKSMGGRIASQVAARHAEAAGPLAGLVFLGYPLHPPGKPDQRRDRHLPDVAAPMLFVQGSRDAFGTPDELRPVLAALTAPADLFVVEGGDHSFAVPKRAGIAQDDVMRRVYDEVASWIGT